MMLDETDKKILRLLQEDAHLTYKDIAKKINLSLTPFMTASSGWSGRSNPKVRNNIK